MAEYWKVTHRHRPYNIIPVAFYVTLEGKIPRTPSWKSLTMQRDLSRELTPSQGVQVKQIYTNIRSDLNELSVML
ncbi:hypothetical protein, partial [Alteromonas macleodii]|uniref:hypothetical protein n=1 Tax=Alteromonas macleodii TaxID=28108 RepID=UPI00196A64DA